jgi:hypothetical protein
VALLPQGWPAGDRAVEVALSEEVTLPPALLWPTGAHRPVIERLAAAVTT